MSKTPGDADSWLDSRAPWSLSISAPLRPWTSTQDLAESIEITNSVGIASPFRLFSRFLAMKMTFELKEIQFPISEDIGIKLGEGTTYIVEKRRLSLFQGEPEDWVAVKRAKFLLPKDPANAVAMVPVSSRRLKAVLLEIEVLLHPPLRSHPNIAQLLGFSWDNNAPGYTPVLVTELASFGTLRQLFCTERVEHCEKRDLCLDVAEALEALHTSMVVHGDIKQDNVLVFPHPQRRFIAKLSDFGLALLGADDSTYRGTAIYNAPEVNLQESNRMPFKIPPEQFPKCDVFSFGLLAFEILNGGQRYYDLPQTKSFQEILMGATTDACDTIKSAVDFLELTALSEDLKDICRSVFQKTLCWSPQDRLPAGWDLVKQLFGASISHHESQPGAISHALHSSRNTQYSMLEIIYGITHDFTGEDLIAELKLTAETACEKEERAQASFDLCLVTTVGGFFTPPTNLENEPLDWLTQAAFLGHKPALRVGRRIFEACQLPVPKVFSTTDLIYDLPEGLNGTAPVDYYSNAVRHLWLRQIKSNTVRHVQYLVKSSRGLNSYVDETINYKFNEVKSTAIADESFLLHLATSTGTTDDLTYLLGLGSNVNKCTPEGLTALHIACMLANTEVVKILLQFGADASINDSANISPLHWLILFPENDILTVVEMLVQAGADIDSCMNEGNQKYFDDLGLVLHRTPLWWALMCRNHTAISALLSHDAKPFSRPLSEGPDTKMGYIHTSLGTVCPDTLELLLENSAILQNMTREDKQFCVCEIGSLTSNQFQRWCMHGKGYEEAYSQVLRVLRRFNITFDESAAVTGFTPLGRAAFSCNAFLVKALILEGAAVNFRLKKYHPTAIEWALSNAKQIPDTFKVVKMIELLLDSGAGVEPAPAEEERFEYSRYHHEILYLAVSFGAPISVVQYLLQRVPTQINRRWRGKTALHLVPFEYEEPVASRIGSLLIDSGIDLNAEDDHGSNEWTCCWTAAARGVGFQNWRFTKICLDRGSSLELGISGGHHRSVVHIALREAFIIEHSEHEIRETINKSRKETAEFLSLVLSHPASKRAGIVNKPDFKELTPLMWAIIWALPTCVAVLLEYGAKTEGEQCGRSLFDLLETCYHNTASLEFTVADDAYEGLGSIKTVREYGGCDVLPVKESIYLNRLDRISLQLRHRISSDEGAGSVSAPNTSSPLR